MRILITAGNTQTPIDDVRVITNVFSGRTGGQIAVTASQRGHSVTLLTSHPEVVAEHAQQGFDGWTVIAYRTFDELAAEMASEVQTGQYHAIIHCAAVSDYQVAGIYSLPPTLQFDPVTARLASNDDHAALVPPLIDARRGKIQSHHGELWMRLTPTPKLVDQIRNDWGFQGVLVKFKLEVGVSDTQLIAIGERSRVHSRADLMVANTRDDKEICAFLGPLCSTPDGPANGATSGQSSASANAPQYERILRSELAERILVEVERLATKSADNAAKFS